MSGKTILKNVSPFRRAIVSEIAKHLKMTDGEATEFLIAKVCTPNGKKELRKLFESF